MTDAELHLFNEGRLFQAYERLGGHAVAGESAWRFAVWAPNAEIVSVAHEGNGWAPDADRLQPLGASGIWSGTLDGLAPGTPYKYWIRPRHAEARYKADPVGFGTETPPRTASVLTDLEYEWGDGAWMARRSAWRPDDQPVSVYELHLGSWRRHADGAWYSY